ncbi:Lipolytic protein G-D-S-L family [Verrucomicrobia bacterium]|nr:Lipolytic protein G-D-S-L family [Verrucomicrobiota bacterium]
MRLRQLAMIGLLCACLAPVVAVRAQATNAGKSSPNLAPTRFANEIDGFLAADKTHPPPKKAILFIGSSIFGQWANLSEQMAPLPVFNRAFGGSLTTDLLYYMDKVVLTYEPRIIVYYCGSNDINAGRSADKVFAGFRSFVERVHARLPQTRIFYVSINRAPQKQGKWDVVDAANKLARDFCAKDKALGFIDVNPALFDARGQPRLDLYLPDKLHFKPPAYEAFAALIKPVVAQAWAQRAKGNE